MGTPPVPVSCWLLQKVLPLLLSCLTIPPPSHNFAYLHLFSYIRNTNTDTSISTITNMNKNTNTNNSKGPPFYWAAWLPLHPHTTSARHVLHTSTCSLSSKIFLQIQIKNKCKSKYKYSDACLPLHHHITFAYHHLLCLITTHYIPCGWHSFPPLFVKWHMHLVCCLEVYVQNLIMIFIAMLFYSGILIQNVQKSHQH